MNFRIMLLTLFVYIFTKAFGCGVDIISLIKYIIKYNINPRIGTYFNGKYRTIERHNTFLVNVVIFYVNISLHNNRED